MAAWSPAARRAAGGVAAASAAVAGACAARGGEALEGARAAWFSDRPVAADSGADFFLRGAGAFGVRRARAPRLCAAPGHRRARAPLLRTAALGTRQSRHWLTLSACRPRARAQGLISGWIVVDQSVRRWAGPSGAGAALALARVPLATAGGLTAAAVAYEVTSPATSGGLRVGRMAAYVWDGLMADVFGRAPGELPRWVLDGYVPGPRERRGGRGAAAASTTVPPPHALHFELSRRRMAEELGSEWLEPTSPRAPPAGAPGGGAGVKGDVSDGAAAFVAGDALAHTPSTKGIVAFDEDLARAAEAFATRHARVQALEARGNDSAGSLASARADRDGVAEEFRGSHNGADLVRLLREDVRAKAERLAGVRESIDKLSAAIDWTEDSVALRELRLEERRAKAEVRLSLSRAEAVAARPRRWLLTTFCLRAACRPWCGAPRRRQQHCARVRGATGSPWTSTCAAAGGGRGTASPAIPSRGCGGRRRGASW